VQLGQPRLARFSWQMYSGRAVSTYGTHIQFEIMYADRVVQPVDLASYLGRNRMELDLAQIMPPHLCTVVEGAHAVRLTFEPSQQQKIYECYP